MNLAYKDKNKAFWLIGGSRLLGTPYFLLELELEDLALDLLDGGVCILNDDGDEDEEMGPSGMLGGRKTAAQRSYSRQSNSDLASRYLDSSRVSRSASCASRLGVRTIEAVS